MFGDRLKAYRKSLGQTEDEMAEHLGMSKSTYWRLEHTAKPLLYRVERSTRRSQ
ncbi:MAG: helix-turn-helix transcriptional regulator [Flavobacteriales bacterium]|nr:helix-turn-helix transcriptional regulator [Flavobacteriales bacterium]